MKNKIRMALAVLCMTISLVSLAGCQFFDLLRSIVGYDGAEELVPDTSELEELLTVTESGEPSSPYIGNFTMHYAYDYQSDEFIVEASFTQKMEFRYTGTGDHTLEPYLFLEEFSGTQTTKMAGLDQGAYCWVTFLHTVSYRISGSFDPVTCSVVLIGIEAAPTNSEVTEYTCPAMIVEGLVPEIYYIPPPTAQNFKLEKTGVIFSIDDHIFSISDLYLPTLEMSCPAK